MLVYESFKSAAPPERANQTYHVFAHRVHHFVEAPVCAIQCIEETADFARWLHGQNVCCLRLLLGGAGVMAPAKMLTV